MRRFSNADLFAYETGKVFVEYFNQLKRDVPSPNDFAKDVWFRRFTFLDRPGKDGQSSRLHEFAEDFELACA